MSLFQRSDGSFILHRIVGEKNGAFYFCGDYETKKECKTNLQKFKNDRFGISCDFVPKHAI